MSNCLKVAPPMLGIWAFKNKSHIQDGWLLLPIITRNLHINNFFKL